MLNVSINVAIINYIMWNDELFINEEWDDEQHFVIDCNKKTQIITNLFKKYIKEVYQCFTEDLTLQKLQCIINPQEVMPSVYNFIKTNRYN